MRKSLNILFIYCTEDYPRKFSANNTKISLLSESLSNSGAKVLLVNNPKFNIDNTNNNIQINGIEVFNFKKSSFSKRIKDLNSLLISHFDANKINIIITSCGNFQDHLTTILLAKNKKYKVGYIYQEWHWSLEKTIKGKLNAYLNDFILLKYYDFILPISEYLINKTKKLNLNIFKLPILAKFELPLNNYSPRCVKESYFVYCASASYKQAIHFIIHSFLLVQGNSRLKLILNGTEDEIFILNQWIKDIDKSSKIDIYTKLPYKQLMNLYIGATALLIPLIPNYTPDIARFSQKIAEYLSSRRPIVTTNVGEINYYFKDSCNAYITQYNCKLFAQKLDWILQHPQEADSVGSLGYKFAEKNFNVKTISHQLSQYIIKKFST